MLNLGVPELILILVLALVILGPGKLPEVGRALGKGIKEFRKATTSITNETEEAVKAEKAKTEMLTPMNSTTDSERVRPLIPR